MNKVEVIKAKTNIIDRGKSKNVDRKLRVAAYCRVSTDDEEQLNSYRSQVQHYTDMIRKNPEWMLAGIYADEAITGTQVAKREDFQRLHQPWQQRQRERQHRRLRTAGGRPSGESPSDGL